jgi:hypothetical protein
MLPDFENPLWGVVSKREIFVRSLWEFGWDEFVWGFRLGEKWLEFGHLLLADLLEKLLLHILSRDTLEEVDVGKGELDPHLLLFGKTFDLGFLDKVREKQVMAKLTSDKSSDRSSQRTDGLIGLEKLPESLVELDIIHKDVVEDLLG